MKKRTKNLLMIAGMFVVTLVTYLFPEINTGEAILAMGFLSYVIYNEPDKEESITE